MKKIIVGTGLIIFNDKGQVLLVKDIHSKRGGSKNKWGIVGGVLEKELSFTENTLKEALEETGYKVELTGLVGVYQHIDEEYNRISIIFRAESREKVGEMDHEEISMMRWFDYENIPWTDLRFPHNQEMLQDAFALPEDIARSNMRVIKIHDM